MKFTSIAEAPPMFIMQGMINLKPQISNLKTQISNLKTIFIYGKFFRRNH